MTHARLMSPLNPARLATMAVDDGGRGLSELVQACARRAIAGCARAEGGGRETLNARAPTPVCPFPARRRSRGAGKGGHRPHVSAGGCSRSDHSPSRLRGGASARRARSKQVPALRAP